MTNTDTPVTLPIGLTTLVQCPSTGGDIVKGLMFNNTVAYNIIISYFSQKTNTTTKLYALELSAGDTVIDDKIYYLSKYDKIMVNCNVAGTTCLITKESSV